MQTVCALEAGLESTDPGDYVLRVCGAAEYLTSESALHDYQYVQRCIKYEEDVRLSLIHAEQLTLPLQRTVRGGGGGGGLGPGSVISFGIGSFLFIGFVRIFC